MIVVKRVYVYQIPESKINTYSAADPVTILNKLVINSKNFQEMLPIFNSLKNKGEKIPSIRYYNNKTCAGKIKALINIITTKIWIHIIGIHN